MRILAFILLIVFSGFSNSEAYIVVQTKQFTVKGTTSVGDFECHYFPSVKDTLALQSHSKHHKLCFDIPVKDFGCGNFMLTRDFRKTVKEKQYPYAKVEVMNVRKKGNAFSCDLFIMLAGKQKVYKDIPLKKDQNQLLGETILLFRDFDLSPPRKLGGIIKVKDEIEVALKMVLD